MLILAMEANVNGNPFDATKHIDHINALQLAGPDHCEKLAAAREPAASLALTPGMWLQWIEDGIALAASPQDLTRVS
jgi:hypothetical protein